MTILEAVNEMLESVGEPPVTALDTGGTSDAGQAEGILDRERQRILRQGWVANTLLDRTFTPSAGTITLTVSTLDVLRFRPSKGQYGTFTRRGTSLYDVENHTATFTASVDLDVMLDIAFTNLTDALAAYIVKVASVRFQRYLKRGTIDDAMNREELMAARVAAQREERELRRKGVLDTASARAMRGDRSFRSTEAWSG